MEINKNCKFFLRIAYSYDIAACHYVILERLGFDLTGIPRDNKKERNIKIGLLMKENPRVTGILRNTTKSLLDECILKNNIKDDEIVLRQYDGLITTKQLTEVSNQYIPLELRNVFDSFLISIDRKKFLAFDSILSEISIKGISYRYPRMDGIYEKLIKINYGKKTSVFSDLQKIKDEVMSSNDPMLYAIPTSEGKYNIFLIRYGQIEISESMARVMDPSDIDRQQYFDFYIRPFSESIVVEFV